MRSRGVAPFGTLAALALVPLFAGSPARAQIPGSGLAPEVRILSAGFHCDPNAPDLVSLPAGGFAAGWLDGQRNPQLVRFDREGARRGPFTRLASPFGTFPLGLRIAVSPSGTIAGGWVEEEGPRVQLLDADDQREEQPVGTIELEGVSPYGPSGIGGELFELFDLVADPAGGFLALWVGLGTEMVRIEEDGEAVPIVLPEGVDPITSSFHALIHPDGHLWWIEHVDLPTSPPSSLLRVARMRLEGPDAFDVEELLSTVGSDHTRAALAVDAQGEVVAAWNDAGRISAQVLDAQGGLRGGPIPVFNVERSFDGGLDVAVDAEGNFAVVFDQDFLDPEPDSPGSVVLARSFAADGSPLGPAYELAAVPDGHLVAPSAAVSGPGEATAAWWWFRPIPILPPTCLEGQGIFGRKFPLGGERALLLDDGRFRVEVDWQDPFNGGSGFGRPVPDTVDSGGFWFFHPDNTELKVKVIDGREVNGHFWFFAGSLSNVEYRITVTDQRTGSVREYENPPRVFGSLADTMAFPGEPEAPLAGPSVSRIGGALEDSPFGRMDPDDVPIFLADVGAVTPRVAALPDGDFFVAWNNSGSVQAARFDDHGAATAPRIFGGGRFDRSPAVATSPEGHAAWIWVDGEAGAIRATLLDPGGATLFHRLEIGDGTTSAQLRVASLDGGRFLTAWTENDRIRIKLLDAEGPGASRLMTAGTEGCLLRVEDLARNPAGGAVLAWTEVCTEPRAESTFFQPLDASGDPLGTPREISLDVFFPSMIVDSQSRVVLVWENGSQVLLQRWSPNGVPVGPLFEVSGPSDEPEFFQRSPSLTVDAEDNLLVVWVEAEGLARNVQIRAFLPRGGPVGPPRSLSRLIPGTDPTFGFITASDPVVAVTEAGKAVVVWSAGGAESFPFGLFAREVNLGGERELLLGEGRFRVEVAWQDPFNGGEGVGHAIPDTADSGGFWFFDPDNTELKVKVIDGRPVNGHFWFFYGALSNVGYQITVTDQLTGQMSLYTNPPGQLASFADTSAFPIP